jgi:hypothetical protein
MWMRAQECGKVDRYEILAVEVRVYVIVYVHDELKCSQRWELDCIYCLDEFVKGVVREIIIVHQGKFEFQCVKMGR